MTQEGHRRVRSPRNTRSGARWLAGFGCLCLVASGCSLSDWANNGFKVGPNYARPPAAVAEQWIDYRDPRVKSQEADLSEWWHVLQDPVLDGLIEEAYQQNLTVRQAGARILQARAVRGIAVGNLFPQTQQALGDHRHVKVSQEAANSPPAAWFQDDRMGFTAAWELDLWGLYRRSIEAADAALDASVENYDDVLVVLFADVAASYVQFRTFEQRLVYARRNVETQTKSFQLASDKFQAGATTERDVQQAKQNLEQTKALVPQLEIGRRQAANRLCVLLGLPPTELSQRLGTKGIPQAPDNLSFGVPTELLRRRPDIRRNERLVAAQSARIGVAEADLYPHFSLLGTIGVNADNFKDLFKTPRSTFGEIGPSFRWDILNYGRIANNIALQDALFQELAFDYQQSVLQAGREVEDGMVTFLRFQERSGYLASSVQAAERTVAITNEQYRQGAVDFTPLFIFEQSLADQQDQLAANQGDVILSLISIYRALGGGWEMRLSREGDGSSGGACAVSGTPHADNRPATQEKPVVPASYTPPPRQALKGSRSFVQGTAGRSEP